MTKQDYFRRCFMAKSIYSRVLLKLSGETLKGDLDFGYSPESCAIVVERVKTILACNVKVALVVGAGNIWRGGRAGDMMNRADADKMGMLATMMNAIALKNFFTAAGVPVLLQCAIPMGGFIPAFDRDQANAALDEGKLVIFAGGTGNPYFTTDTASTLRALETGCDAVLKATQVDGVYSADPKKDPKAVRYEELSFSEAIDKQLKIMDTAAFTLCREHSLPIVVFDFHHADLDKVLAGDTSAGTIVH